MKKLSKNGYTQKSAKKSKSLSFSRSPKNKITSYIKTSRKSVLKEDSDKPSISNSVENDVDQTGTKNNLMNTFDNNSNVGIERRTESNTIGMVKSSTENLTNTSAIELKDKYHSTFNRNHLKQTNLLAENTQLKVSIPDLSIEKGLCNKLETTFENSDPSNQDSDKYDNGLFTKNSKINSTLRCSPRLSSMTKDDVQIQITPNKCESVSPNVVGSIKHEPRSRSGSFNNEYEKINCDIINMIHDMPCQDDINKNDILELESFEAIEMVHDFDSMMEFDDVKISVFQSPIASTKSVKYSKKQSVEKCRKNGSDNESENNYTSMEESPTSHRQNKKEINEKTILEELKAIKQHQDISEEKQQKLKMLTVELTHEVPEQHKVEILAGTHAPTLAERKIMRSFARMKRGPYTTEEDTIILENWQEFCELHDWDPKDVKPFLFMSYKPSVFYLPDFEDRKKFVQFLAKDLPHRTLCSIYYRFRNLHQKFKNDRYTKSEDKKILAYLGNGSILYSGNHKKYAELALLLNRNRASIFRRYRLLLKKSSTLPKTNVRWTLPLIEDFINELLRVTKVQDVKYLKDVEIPVLIWKKVALKLNIYFDVLKHFWRNQLHMQLFCEEPIYMNDIKVKLIEYLYGKGLAHKSEFNWTKIGKYFDGMHTSHLSRIFKTLLERVPRGSSDNLWEAIEYLYEVHIPKIRNAPFDRMLPRISFENGKAKLIDKKPKE
ncbi:uncharacterized protein LOC107268271 isoform X2 [Cephus cinctus]|uniref:Uncharacterized protein LOC107268271 isoform X2 n=1 Tax=Cephus cinctus TaxID=211228 RepID=A0AAJ7BX11_CEPCN|nr:uncharacterized protein LOC107268271 isoform X2 [Cephus cinctus]